MEDFPSARAHLDGRLNEATTALPQTDSPQPIRSEDPRTQSERPRSELLHVVFQGPRRRFYLTPMTIPTSETSENVMRRLRLLWNQEASKVRYLKHTWLLFWKPTIDIATLSAARMSDIEVRQYPVEVIVSSRTPSAELTAAFHRPSLLRPSDPFVSRYTALLSGSPPSSTATLIGLELNKHSVFWVLFAALVISICIGLITGFVCSRADLGIASTSGLFGMISVLTGLFVWTSK